VWYIPAVGNANEDLADNMVSAEEIPMDDNLRAVYNITGVAGEYFVAAELSRRGWIATLTLKNTPNIDVIATKPDDLRSINIQVKTRSIRNRAGWILTRKIETLMPGENFYLAFVDLKGLSEEPDYYLIPRNEFSTWIAERHSQWLATPGRSGRAHVDNPIRAFDKPQFDLFEKYHNNWNI
jgi:Holliday junction resolvase-like predicted endonuclease